MDYLIYSISSLNDTVVDTSVLSAAELQEARRRGGSYALVRALLRHEIARRRGIAPADACFSYGPHGKPECDIQHFNISHSGDCLCLAFHDKPIGVDIEQIRPRRFEALAGRFMCDEQLAAFKSRDCPQDEFFACWCAAEALVKHAGDTMWNARNYPFIYRHGRISCLFEPAPVVELFSPETGYCGALAYTQC